MAGDDILLGVNIIKHFLHKIGEKYTLQKKSNTTSDTPKSPDVAINEIMEPITITNDNHTERTEPVHEAVDEDDVTHIGLTIYRYCLCN